MVLVESSAKRCPSCHSRLRRRRKQPIVLGEPSRLDLQAALAVDRRNKRRGERTFASSVAAPAAPPAIDLTEPEPELVAIVVDAHEPEPVEIVAETFAAAPLVAVPVEEPFVAEAVEAILEDVSEVEPEPVVVADAIAAFTLPAPQPEPVAIAEPRVDLDDALDGDVTSIVYALHRKARGVAAEPVEPPVPLFDEPVVDRSARPLRLTASTAGYRRRRSRRDG
jgi:hypothetical protein